MIKDYGIALAKLLLAGAWVDGELSSDEIHSIQAFLDTVPGLEEEDLKRVYLYAAFPMTMEESRQAAQDFVSIIRTDEEKELALLHLDSLVRADRIVTPEERCFYEEILDYLHDAPTSHFKHFSKVFRNRSKWKLVQIPKGKDRESLWLHHFIHNPVYFRLQTSHLTFGLPKTLSSEAFEEACLHASLITMVEIAGGASFRPELIVQALQKRFHCAPEIAAYLVDLASEQYDRKQLNLVRQSRQLIKLVAPDAAQAFFFELLETLAEAGTPEADKHESLRELAEALGINEDATTQALKSLVA